MVVRSKSVKVKKSSTLRRFPSTKIENTKVTASALGRSSFFKGWAKKVKRDLPDGWSLRDFKLSQIYKILSEETFAAFALKIREKGEDLKFLPFLLALDPENFFKKWPPKNNKGEIDYRELKREINRNCDLISKTIEIPIVRKNPALIKELQNFLDTYKAIQSFVEDPELRIRLIHKQIAENEAIYHLFVNSELSKSSEKMFFAPTMDELAIRIVPKLYEYLQGCLLVPSKTKKTPIQRKFPFIDNMISEIFRGKIPPKKVRYLYNPKRKMDY